MGVAHNGEDDIAFYAAALGHTYALSFGTAGANLPDADGPLLPGRYLAQLRTNGNGYSWLSTGKWEKGVSIPTPAGPPAFPMSNNSIVAIEFHVRKGHNDRIAAQTEMGDAIIYITLVSYGA